MPKCTIPPMQLTKQGRREIEAIFNGGHITSDAGVVLLREIDKRTQLTSKAAKTLQDRRHPDRIVHSYLSQIRQRVYGLALGYEDLNDHQELRRDLALQTAVERDTPLASTSTLHRFEQASNRQTLWKLHEVLLEQFLRSHEKPPKQLILDFDATDDPVHGHQERRSFNGYYRHYCFLPLYVFCDQQLLVSYLRPSNIDGAKHAWAILALLVKNLRKHWPDVQIIFRGDSGFCRHKMLSWCERHRVDYIIGIAQNARLMNASQPLRDEVADHCEQYGITQRQFDDFYYAAYSWKHRERRIIVKAEHTVKGANPRFIVTSLSGEPQPLYEHVYCARGNMENRIKEQQLDLFADRTSCSKWWPNQFRLMLSSLAYTLLETLRRVYLQETELAFALAGTLRLKLLKIGAVVLRNTRRVQFFLSSSYPYQELFAQLVKRLVPQ